MKVKIGNFKPQITIYKMVEGIFFWTGQNNEFGLKEYPDWVSKVSEFLTYGSIKKDPEPGEVFSLFPRRKMTVLGKFVLWINSKIHRKVYVKIDRWDTFDLFTTLSMIILPALKEFRNSPSFGVPSIDMNDISEELRPKDSPSESYFKEGWFWILDEMIWAFENIDNSFIDHRDNDFEFLGRKLDDGSVEWIPTGTKYDEEYITNQRNRRQRGLNLFAKYYLSLWM